MKEYVVTIGGIDHTVLLDEDEAKARQAKPVSKDASPANKSRTAQVRAK